jgi:putative ABC transport system permease protein
MLALGGAVLGTLLSWGGLKSIVALMPQDIIPAEAVIRLNAPVLLFALGVTILTALTFGLVPALKAARKDLNEPLRDIGKGLSGGFRHGRLRNAVVILEVALSLTLMVAAGLLMRSFVALREVHLGFQTRSRTVSQAAAPGRTVQDRGSDRRLLSAFITAPEGLAGCGRCHRDQHTTALRRHPERHRSSRKDSFRETGIHLPALQ